MQGAHHSPHSNKGRGNQHRADGYLQHEQSVPDGEPPAHVGRGSCLDDLVRTGAENLADRDGTKEASAEKRQQQRDSVDAGVGVDRRMHGEIPERLPNAQPSQQCHAGPESHCATDEGKQHGLSKQAAQDAIPARSECQAQCHFARTVGGARSKQAAQVGARGQKNQRCQQHQSGNEFLDGAIHLIAEKAWPAQGKAHVALVFRIGFFEPGTNRVQIGDRLRGSDTRLEMTDDLKKPAASAIAQVVGSIHLLLVGQRHEEVGRVDH